MLTPSKAAMNQMIKDCLGDNYFMVSSVSLQATHLVVFAHLKLGPLISSVSTDSVATGLKGSMGNKGSVKVSFKLAETSITVINSHLHSGQDEVVQRNKDIKQILKKFIEP